MEYTKQNAISTVEYNTSKPNLDADIIVGGVNFSLATSLSDDGTEYYPKSALVEDIRHLVKNPSQVLCIFQKDLRSTEKYEKIKYVAKGVDLRKVQFPLSVEQMINIGA